MSHLVQKINHTGHIIRRTIRYNLQIIFGNKFIYFLIGAMIFYLFVVTVNVLSGHASMEMEDIYVLLLVPGILLMFYPTTHGIQNDSDRRTLEILFGIPNYRYKVWLVRLAIIVLLVTGILWFLALLSVGLFSLHSPTQLTLQVMFPLVFLGCMAFCTSTLIKNGAGTATIMIILGLAIWIAGEAIQKSAFNIFFNPFDLPGDMTEPMVQAIMIKNRIYLIIGSILCLLWGLVNLQKREKFIG
jgi:hypothetical protein